MHFAFRALLSAGTVALLFLIAGCTHSTGSQVSVSLPPTTGAFDYQLGGGYPPNRGVSVLTRDSTDKPAKGIYSICYVNGFQTQPGEVWPESLVVNTTTGTPLVDPGWPDEQLIDISTEAKRSQALARQQTTIAVCAKKGFQAIEFDNLDSWTRSNGALTQDDAIAFAKLLVNSAHEEHLAASQKNTPELAAIGKQNIGFDFATTEACDRYSECVAYSEVYGDHVFNIEYTDHLRDTFSAVCTRASTPQRTILRDRDLMQRDDSGYTYEKC